jgi:RNA polymerase subunit RPABC4/transcription elongation factor Spt4
MSLDQLGIWMTVVKAGGFLLVSCFVLLWLAGIVWAFNDAAKRSRGGMLQIVGVTLAAVFFVPGILAYLAIRPSETLADAAEQRMALEFAAQQVMLTPRCTTCARSVREDFSHCPYCASVLQERCDSCEHLLKQEWVTCPFCGVAPTRERTAAALRERPQTAEQPRMRPAAGRPVLANDSPRLNVFEPTSAPGANGAGVMTSAMPQQRPRVRL